MQQSIKNTVLLVPSGGSSKRIRGTDSDFPPRAWNTNSYRFADWIDRSRESTNFVSGVQTRITTSRSRSRRRRRSDNNRKQCCINSTSSGYSSHSPPLSSIFCQGTEQRKLQSSGGVPVNPQEPPPTIAAPVHRRHCRNSSSSSSSSSSPRHLLHHHHHHHPGISSSGAVQGQRNLGSSPGLAVIHEAELPIPRPIWPFMAEEQDESKLFERRNEMTTKADESSHHQPVYSCCDYCRCSSYVSRNALGDSTTTTTTTTTAPTSSYSSSAATAAAAAASQVLIQLSRTLNSVIEADSRQRLSAEEILRDISITVARGIERANQSPSSAVRQDYTYRLSSSSSNASAAGKESIGVNPVNLRVYSKPKWLHVPASSRSSSTHSPYEVKNLIASPPKIIRSEDTINENPRSFQDKSGVAPAVFILPQTRYNPNARTNRNSNAIECKSNRKRDSVKEHFEESKRNQSMGRNVVNCVAAGEPVYTTLDASDESSSYGAIGDQTDKTSSTTKVFDRHLDFTLDGNRAERLGRAIAKAKRKRQWCRGVTALFGLVFFVLSVVVVSLSVTRGRKVFGSM